MPKQRIREAVRDINDFPKEGIIFKDITPVLLDYTLCDDIANSFAKEFADVKIDLVIGVESRGFLFGMLLAQKLKVGFVPVRKVGKLPCKTISYSYNLEYGTAVVEVHEDAIEKGSNVLIHDDLLATGGTAMAAAELVRKSGGHVAGFAFLVELQFLKGKEILDKYSDKIVSLIQYK